eukprot:gnl/TRDRNA2_/TRDRNA2_137071_c0_seq2.p1 gnl/TRDRNA2_/TRDRNA2_137071_c0~~gnl/TRDRNA2_/TRDRNA2_137071_c0_seq2.p1  ORF type:complete len:850 (-),score=118.34 gnl/TRDRNA2_/TRDRNA2_137071_c0_seq2:124-2628(-)
MVAEGKHVSWGFTTGESPSGDDSFSAEIEVVDTDVKARHERRLSRSPQRRRHMRCGRTPPYPPPPIAPPGMLERLQAEVDAEIQRHQSELRRCIDRWTASPIASPCRHLRAVEVSPSPRHSPSPAATSSQKEKQIAHEPEDPPPLPHAVSIEPPPSPQTSVTPFNAFTPMRPRDHSIGPSSAPPRLACTRRNGTTPPALFNIAQAVPEDSGRATPKTPTPKGNVPDTESQLRGTAQADEDWVAHSLNASGASPVSKCSSPSRISSAMQSFSLSFSRNYRVENVSELPDGPFLHGSDGRTLPKPPGARASSSWLGDGPDGADAGEAPASRRPSKTSPLRALPAPYSGSHGIAEGPGGGSMTMSVRIPQVAGDANSEGRAEGERVTSLRKRRLHDAAMEKRRTGQRASSPLSKRRMQMMQARQSVLEKVIQSRYYEFGNAAAIVLNAMLIVWETQRRAQLAAAGSSEDRFLQDEIFFVAIGNVFCFIFVVDLVLRLVTERQQFFLSKERAWNAFDVFVVLTAIVEAVVHLVHLTSSSTSTARRVLRKFSMLRIVRLLRVVRVTRAIRVMRFVRELRVMVYSLTSAVKSLAWSVVLLVLVLIVFGVFFTDGAIEYCRYNNAMEAEATSDLRKYFGTLSRATVSLYMAMTGGEDWAVLMELFEHLPGEYTIVFIAFISFANLALLNLITAVFVETAMQRSQQDREVVVQQEMEHKGEFIATMQQVFDELDTNNSGALSLEEFERHIEDENITAFLSTLELDVGQVRTLFALLDVDQTGEVDIEEFVSGCLRLKGGARNLDIAFLQYQIEWILHNVESIHDIVDEKLGSLTTGPQFEAC